MWPLLSSSQQLGSFEKASAPPGAPWPLWRSQSTALSHRSLSAQGSPSLTASNASHFSLNPGSVESSAQPPLSPPRLQGLDEPRGGGFSRQARRDAESSSCLWASHVALLRTGQRGRAAHTFGMLRPARPLRSVSSRQPVRYGSRALSGLYVLAPVPKPESGAALLSRQARPVGAGRAPARPVTSASHQVPRAAEPLRLLAPRQMAAVKGNANLSSLALLIPLTRVWLLENQVSG